MKNKEDRKIDKFGWVAGQVGKYTLLSPIIAGYGVGYGLYVTAKYLLNPFKDCPCDKKTGIPISKKTNKLWLKNMTKTFKKTKEIKKRRGKGKFAIKCPPPKY